MYDDYRHLADPDGIVLRRDVLAAGGTDAALRRAVRAMVLVRVRQGAYSLADAWAARTREERHLLLGRLAYLFSRAAVVLSHTSAAVFHDAPMNGLPLDTVHLTRRDRKAGRKEAGIAQHRGRLRATDVVDVGTFEVTTPTRTALDLTTISGLEHSVPVMDHFLRYEMTTKKELLLGCERMRSWANTLGTGIAINFADGRRESMGESLTSLMLRGSGRPQPEPQYKIRDASGRVVARVDFAWPELGVFLEFDGKVKYQELLKAGEDVTTVVLREKKREEMICRITGWRCIRIVWADLHRASRTVAHIVSVLDGGPVHL